MVKTVVVSILSDEEESTLISQSYNSIHDFLNILFPHESNYLKSVDDMFTNKDDPNNEYAMYILQKQKEIKSYISSLQMPEYCRKIIYLLIDNAAYQSLVDIVQNNTYWTTYKESINK